MLDSSRNVRPDNILETNHITSRYLLCSEVSLDAISPHIWFQLKPAWKFKTGPQPLITISFFTWCPYVQKYTI